ncbi:Copper homeostasis protein CutC [Candidatus Hepatincolaceae symbiont of Richtersius coronifer]
MIIEACTENFRQSQIAQFKGANRIELCENLAQGGTTPSYGTIKVAVDKLSIPVLIMIRPKGGDFYYTEDELQIMLNDIKYYKKLPVAGFVLGALKSQGDIGNSTTSIRSASNNSVPRNISFSPKIDYKVMDKLITACGTLPVTFHKAFDVLENAYLEIEQLAKLGVKRILTSGGKSTALEGLDDLNKILVQCNKYNVELVACGNINPNNLQKITQYLKAPAFHGREIVGSLQD